ncbi:MAG: hydrogenase maturation protease [Terriglobales bacterium]
MKQVLVAGIGNIFLGDDAFGSEAARALAEHSWPPGVVIRDFGIRCLDLAYALGEGWSAVIVLDAVSRGQAPGTLYRIALEEEAEEDEPEAGRDAHSVGVEHVRALAHRMGVALPPMVLLGCEPECLEPSMDEDCALSPPVRRALPQALVMAEALACEFMTSQKEEAIRT